MPWLPAPSPSGWALRPGEVLALVTRLASRGLVLGPLVLVPNLVGGWLTIRSSRPPGYPPDRARQRTLLAVQVPGVRSHRMRARHGFGGGADQPRQPEWNEVAQPEASIGRKRVALIVRAVALALGLNGLAWAAAAWRPTTGPGRW